MRDTSLFTAEASPAWDSDTELRAVAVSGATVVARPMAMTSTAGQDAGQVGRALRDSDQQGQAQADDDRSDTHLETRPDPGRHPTRPGREGQHHHGQRQQRDSRLERGVVVDDLEDDREEEQHPTQAGVDHQGHGVGDRELAVAEQSEWQHRRRRPVLDHGEGTRTDHADDQCHQHSRCRPAAFGSFDQRVGDRAERSGDQGCAHARPPDR